MLRKRSFGSVEVISIDEAALRDALAAGVESCVAAHPEVEVILLFGSFARGDWAPDSDVDLLVVVKDISVPTLERAGLFRPFFRSIPLDVNPMVVTREELTRASADPASVLNGAVAEGRVLFDRSSA